MTPAATADPLRVRLLYSPHDPEPPQAAFLLLGELEVLEALYGGAGGGGKSDALLMAALQYVDVPQYAALLLRKTYADLALPGALIDRAHLWLGGTDARWSAQENRWTFPSGASLSFGYLQTSNDRYRYASAEFQYIAFDELTQFPEADYRFLFTRLRRPAGAENPLAQVPLRMRAASNPGGRGHEWVKRRFITREPAEGETLATAQARVFVPARLADNPHIDQDAYIASLDQVDPYLRAQILEGDWDAREPGDWVYDHHGIAAAEQAGARLDLELAQATIAPPASPLTIGIDWGEHTHALIGWPLEGGGIYITAGVELTSVEPGASTNTILSLLDDIVALGRQRRPGATVNNRYPAGHPPPALNPYGDTLTLVSDHRYDAAGVQSMRTYSKTIRRRHPTARTTAIPFGAPAPRSGTSGSIERRSYKTETIGHLRRLFTRTADGHDTGIIAISPTRCRELLRQLRALEWKNPDQGIVRKGDDHGPDALIALDAPNAIRHR